MPYKVATFFIFLTLVSGFLITFTDPKGTVEFFLWGVQIGSVVAAIVAYVSWLRRKD